MNKKEKLAVCELVAGWEFSVGGSSSEAAARYSCSNDIREALGITDEDMAFSRMWEIAKLVGDTSDEFTDLLIDAVEADYQAVIDAFEAGPAVLRAHVAPTGTSGTGGGDE